MMPNILAFHTAVSY